MVLSNILENHLQGCVQTMIANLQTHSVVDPDLILNQSSTLGLLVSAFRHLPPQVWLREGKVEASEIRNTTVQDIVRILGSIKGTPTIASKHSYGANWVGLLLAEIEGCIDEDLQCAALPQKTVDYMEKQRAKLGDLTFSSG